MRKLSESDLGAFNIKLNRAVKHVSSTKHVPVIRRTSHNTLQYTKTFTNKQNDHKHSVAAKENLATGNTTDKTKRSLTSSVPANKKNTGSAKIKQSSYFPSKVMRENFFKTSFQSYNAEQIMAQTGRVQMKEGFLKETFNRTENKNDAKCMMLKDIKHEVNSKLNKNKEQRREEGASTPIIKSTLESTQTRVSNILSFTLPLFPKIPADINKKLSIISEPSCNSKRYLTILILVSYSPLSAIVNVIVVFHVVLKQQIGYV
jgi:hypothetical protein